MLNVVMLSVIMLNVVMLSVIILNVVMLSVIMLSVVRRMYNYGVFMAIPTNLRRNINKIYFLKVAKLLSLKRNNDG
jgi:hypothetical protein